MRSATMSDTPVIERYPVLGREPYEPQVEPADLG
jgi:hypothetical protein